MCFDLNLHFQVLKKLKLTWTNGLRQLKVPGLNVYLYHEYSVAEMNSLPVT